MELSAIDSGSGPAVLLLHGQPGTRADWSPVARRLRGVRAIVPDRPGYGRTGGAAGGIGDNATAAVELLDRLEVGSAVVAGHSWGAAAALAMASRFPERVSALVLAGAFASPTQLSLLDRAFAHPRFGPPATRLAFRAGGLALSLPFMDRLARAAVPGLKPNRLAKTAAEWRGDGVWRSFYAEQRALVEELPSLAPHLPEIKAPTTILAGGRDRIARPSHARALAATLPNATLLDVDGVGHLLPQQRPDLVAEVIQAAASVPS